MNTRRLSAADAVAFQALRLRALLEAGGSDGPSRGIGLLNVDDRLRQVYGEEYGLVIETAVGAGMKVSLRVPKCHTGLSPG